MNIPARYCTGYLGDIGVPKADSPMDFSPWFEAYLDGQWYAFDPRNNIPVLVEYSWPVAATQLMLRFTTTFGVSKLESFRVWTDEVVSV